MPSATPSWNLLSTQHLAEYTISTSTQRRADQPRPRVAGGTLVRKARFADGQPISCLFDFECTAFHNAHESLHRGSGPYSTCPNQPSGRRASRGTTLCLFNAAQDELHHRSRHHSGNCRLTKPIPGASRWTTKSCMSYVSTPLYIITLALDLYFSMIKEAAQPPASCCQPDRSR